MSAVEKLPEHNYETAKISTGVVQEFCLKLLEMGIPAQALIEIYDFRQYISSEREQRIPINVYKTLISLANTYFSGKEVGLITGERSEASKNGALGKLFCANRELRQSIKCLVKYSRVLGDHIFFDFEESNEYFSISYRQSSEFSCRDDVIKTFSALLNWIRVFTGQDVRPTKVAFQFDNHGPKRPFEKAFSTDVLFSQFSNTLYFKADLLNVKNPRYDTKRHEDLITEVKNLHACLTTQDSFINRVRRIIEQDPTSESLSADTIAEEMNMSKRTFFRRLQSFGTSYQSLLDDVRRDMATNFITSDSYQLKRLPCLLGYSDARCFDRAFRRWTGYTARQFSNQIKHVSY